jgi:hypothetical protein
MATHPASALSTMRRRGVIRQPGRPASATRVGGPRIVVEAYGFPHIGQRALTYLNNSRVRIARIDDDLAGGRRGQRAGEQREIRHRVLFGHEAVVAKRQKAQPTTTQSNGQLTGSISASYLRGRSFPIAAACRAASVLAVFCISDDG